MKEIIKILSTLPAASKQGQGQEQEQNGLLNALNLSGMRAWTAADENTSSRCLMHMQQLLFADSPLASPRCTIAPRWRSLHGERGWEGLLYPLDSDLRRDLLQYGDFVQAAYRAFYSLPTVSARHRGLMLPCRSYRPTRSLFATSPLSMPPWAKRPNTPEWLTQQSNWVGYVAVCESEREVARMGRRDIAIVLRGTATCLEWAENLRASQVPLDGADTGAEEPKVARGFLSLYKTAEEKVKSLSEEVMGEVRRLMDMYEGEELSVTAVGRAATILEWVENLRPPLVPLDDGANTGAKEPKVARGFLSLYKTAGEKVKSLSEEVMDEVRRLMDKYKGEELSITVIGHSLGAALALLIADEVATSIPDVPPVAVVSFSGPKVGNAAFVDRLSRSGKVNVLRIVNAGVGKVPGVALKKEQYQHVGAELRIDSKNSPCRCLGRHDQEAYLHLIDGFIDGFTGTGRPFQHDARRSVIRLLQLRRGIVKKEYVNRARELDIANLDRVLGKPPQPPRPAGHRQKQEREQEQRDAEEQEPLNACLLNALNLSSFVPMPGMHMSPRSLIHMLQLLSADSPRASPRSTIAPRWRRLHGWRGCAGGRSGTTRAAA